ncbi:MAG: alpha/beta hydrolase [Chloroflexota bacterium]|nr:alpha/beta hydrolase [Chloroflexota bacterium]
MPYADVNDIRIWYEIRGKTAVMPLVLTHGFAGPSRQWWPEIEPLAEERPVVMYDVRGHDRTSVPPDEASYSMPQFASDLAGLLREIGIERAHIGGVSMGGMVTAQFAVDYPEMCESVMICDSTCGNGADSGPGGDWERRMLEGFGMLTHMVEKYGLKETTTRQEEWKQQNDQHYDVSPYDFEKDDLERIKLMTVEGYLGAAHAIVTRPDLTDRIQLITAPAMVMVGEWDDFVPCAMRDHALITGSRLVVRERCGHGSRWRAETFLAEVESFLADVESGNPIAIERHV